MSVLSDDDVHLGESYMLAWHWHHEPVQVIAVSVDMGPDPPILAYLVKAASGDEFPVYARELLPCPPSSLQLNS